MLYGKKLLTNNDSLIQSPFFSPDKYLVLNGSINKEDVRTFLSRNDTLNNESPVSHISPQDFLNYIGGLLSTKNGGHESIKLRQAEGNHNRNQNP